MEGENTEAGRLTERIMLTLFSCLGPNGKALVFDLPSYVYNPAYEAVLSILKGTYPKKIHTDAADRYLEQFQRAQLYPELRDFVRQVIKDAKPTDD